MRPLDSKLPLYGRSSFSALVSVALASMTFFFRPVSARYITQNITMVLFALSRLQLSTSNHSSCSSMRLMALIWNLAKGYLAYMGKKYCIHSTG